MSAKRKTASFHITGINTITDVANIVMASAATKSTTGEAKIEPLLRSIKAVENTVGYP
jgi:hypothetical protein